MCTQNPALVSVGAFLYDSPLPPVCARCAVAKSDLICTAVLIPYQQIVQHHRRGLGVCWYHTMRRHLDRYQVVCASVTYSISKSANSHV